jgi:hypothetical protein
MRGAAIIAAGSLAVLAAAFVFSSSSDDDAAPESVVVAASPRSASSPSSAHAQDRGRSRSNPSTIQVTVIEEGSRGRVANARVVQLRTPTEIAWRQNVRAEWTTDAKGQVEIELADARGPVFLAATAAGHIWSRALPAGSSELRLDVPAAVEVTGQILGTDGPAEGVAVEIRNDVYDDPDDLGREPGDSWSEVTTDSTGTFRLWARPGSAVVSAGGALFRSKSAATPVPGPPLTFMLEPASGIRGRVVTSTGKPAIGTQVTFAFHTVDVGDDGRYEIDGLAPSEGELTALLELSAGNETVQSSARLDLGRWTTANLQLTPAGVLDGFVLDGAGQPVSGATVIATELYEARESEPLPLTFRERYGAADTDAPRGTAGRDGSFRLATRLPSGQTRYLVRAFTPLASAFLEARSAPVGTQQLPLHLKNDALVTGTVALDAYSILGVEHHGSFTLARDSLPDQLTIEAPHHRPHAVELPEGPVDLGTISLVETHDVELEVTELETGLPITGIEYAIEGDPQKQARDEHLLIRDVPLPSAKVRIGTGHHRVAIIELGAAPTAHATLSKGTSVHFRFVPAPRSPRSRIFIRCDSDEGLVLERDAMPMGGEATLSGLSPGRCFWYHYGQHDQRGEIDVPPSGTLEVVVPTADPAIDETDYRSETIEL